MKNKPRIAVIIAGCAIVLAVSASEETDAAWQAFNKLKSSVAAFAVSCQTAANAPPTVNVLELQTYLIEASMKIQGDANVYLRLSPALYADIYTHAENVTSEELAKMRSSLDAAEKYAKAAIACGQAADKVLLAKKGSTETKRDIQAFAIEAKKLEQSAIPLYER